MRTRITVLPPDEQRYRPPTMAELNAGVDLSRAFTEVTITSRHADQTVRLIGAQALDAARSLGVSMTVLRGTLQKIADQAATMTPSR